MIIMKHSHSFLLLSIVTSGLLLTAGRNLAQTTVFSDDFSGSSLNSARPGAPTATSTSYATVSTQPLGISSIGTGHLNLSVPSSGNGYQIQALFTSSPVTLAAIGDYIQLAVTFTDTGGFLNPTNGTLCIGMYNTGQVGPIAGGVSNENSANTDHATGGAQNWVGYTGQIVTNHSYLNLRTAQTGSGNNNQDVAFGGFISATKGYNNPMSSIGTNNGSVFLAAGGQYTMVLKYQLTGAGALAVDTSLYAGAGTTGTQLSDFSTTASDANFLTDTFDGLAFGFYENKTQNSAIDINQIVVSDMLQPVPEPAVFAVTGLGLLFLARRFRR